MPNFTRNAIRSSFLKLLDERPLSQITVKDIASDCGINRNTFYYYFHDIPALIEDLVMSVAEQLVQEYPSADTIRDFMELALDKLLAHRRALLHIYHSVNREMFEQYLWQVCERIVILYVDSVLDEVEIDETDYTIIIRYLKSLSFGIVSDMLNSGLNEDIRVSFERIIELKQGAVIDMIRRFDRR